MANEKKQFNLSNKAKELLVYTFTVTKPISDRNVDTRETVALLRQLSTLPPDEAHNLSLRTAESMEKKNRKKGFPKSALHTYVKTLQETSVRILRNIHAANECIFRTDYMRRLSLVDKVLDDCNLLLNLIEISCELGYIDTNRMEFWCKKVTDVKYMTLAWRRKDAERAEKMKKEVQTNENKQLSYLLGKAVFEAIMESKRM